jgi:hypothetical protein
MCRNIKKLRYPDRSPTDAELEDAALQFIRKISGYRNPSRRAQPAFDRGVADVAAVSKRLFDELAILNPSQ